MLLTDCVHSELCPAGNSFQRFPQSDWLTELNLSYAPFVTYGFFSLPRGGNDVPVKILHDTGASESFILESTLSFSAASSLGKSVLVQGIALAGISVPLHKVVLKSEWVKGEVIMGVCPSLPVKGVDVILGNNLAGECVWPDVSPLPIVASLPIDNLCDVAAEEFPTVFVMCCYSF